MNKKVRAINPSSSKLEEGTVTNEKVTKKLYQVKFNNGTYWVSKSQVQFIG